MSSIRIGADERRLAEADAHWITQEINARRRDGNSVCVVVTISTDELNLHLATPSCSGGGGGGGRPPTAREKAILDLWSQRGLSESMFQAGDVIAFVQQVQRYL
jgi:hypothetical protein